MESLRVIHLSKGPSQDLSAVARVNELFPGVFHLDSCQRLLWAFFSDELELPELEDFEVYEGAPAYRFLLRVATGLESQIVGETDIFGQLKQAWRKVEDHPEIDWLMQRLFEDTKDIRSRYLQNLGGASYGSLVRMMLKQSPGPTLIVGAGQLAQSVAPYLLDQELWLLNRSAESVGALYELLMARQSSQGGAIPATPKIRIISKEEESQAWSQAAGVVVCIPFDPAKDAARAALRQGKSGPVIHLGGPREAAGAWNETEEFQALDDLFALQKAQGDVRMTQVQQAARACDEKAKLRTLGASVTMPHGWEDLAVFA